MIKTIILVALILMAVIVTGILAKRMDKKPEENKPVYQGAVRPTDDEDYFRKTGITRPLSN